MTLNVRNILPILFSLQLAFLTGCATQKDFSRPEVGSIELGKSTSKDVIRTVGDSHLPMGNEVDVNGEKVRSLTYFYTESPKFWGTIIEKHSLVYTLFNDVVAGEEYNSSYDKDATKFDLDKIKEVKPGMSELNVVSILGQPSGRIVYPLVKEKDGRGIVYAYNYARFAGMLTSENRYLLVITLDKEGYVSTISYSKDGKTQDLS